MKRDLPDTPVEIVQDWLLPFVGRAGWPPKQDNDWRFILGKPRDLAFLQALHWERRVIRLAPDIFDPKDFLRVDGMVRAHIFNELNIYSTMTDSKKRISRCCHYLEEHGTLPKPLILEESISGKFHILDGHHRLCAFLYLYGYIQIEDPKVPCMRVREEQEVWVGVK